MNIVVNWIFNNGQLNVSSVGSVFFAAETIGLLRDIGVNDVVVHGVLCKIINDIYRVLCLITQHRQR